MSKKIKNLSNLVLYKVGWVSCVVFGASQYHLLGTAIIVFICAIAIRTSDKPMATAKLVAVACVIGLVWESILIGNGLMEYKFGQLPTSFAPHWLAPHWIIAMWALFASTFDHSMAWLKAKLWVAAVFGAIGGPLAFFAGERLGAVAIPDALTTGVVLALGWAILTPSLLWLSITLNKASASNKPVGKPASLTAN